MRRKIISILLCIAMIITLTPCTLLADANTYKVYFAANGGTGTMYPINIKVYDHDHYYYLPSCEFTPPVGKVFDYWQVTDDIGNTIDAHSVRVWVESDITLTAVWRDIPTHLVDFNNNGGSGMMSSFYVDSGNSFTLPSSTFTPPMDASFLGWRYNNTLYKPTETLVITADTRFFAEWGYPVTVTNGSAKVNDSAYSGPVAPGTEVTITADEAPTGYVFDKWIDVTGAVNIYDETSSVTHFTSVSVPMEVKATYKDHYDISFDGTDGEGTMDSDTVSPGGDYTLPSCGFSATNGGSFLYWTDGTNNYKTGDKIENVSSDISLKAVWGYPVSITFDSYQCTYIIANSVGNLALPGSKVSFGNGKPAPSGTVFDHWEVVSGGVTVSNPYTSTGSDFVVGNAAVEIKAVFKNLYTISFASNGGSGSMRRISVTEGDSFELPANGFSAPTGATFLNWLYENTLYGENVTYSNVTSGMQFSAVWGYPVTVTGGSATVNGSAYSGPIAPNTSVTITADTAPAGEVFETWEVVSGGITLADSTKETTTFTSTAAVMEVKATYLALHTVSFNLAGGSGTMNSDFVKDGYTYKVPSCGFTGPNGGIFLYWSDGTNNYNVDDEITNVKSDITLTAVWGYPVTVTDGTVKVGGSAYSNPVAPGTEVTITAGTAPTNQIFDKWVVISGDVEISDVNSETATFTSKAAAMEVKATYKPLYTVSYVANGGSGTMNDVPVGSGENFVINACGFTAPLGGTFLNWLYNNTVYLPNTTYNSISGNMEFSAVWGFPVTVNNGSATVGGNAYSNPIVSGTTVTITANPDTSAEAFYRWEVISGNISLDDDTNPTTTFVSTDNAMEVTAVYSPVHTISFLAGGGSGTMDSFTLRECDPFTVPTNEFTGNDGGVFAGWKTEPELSTVKNLYFGMNSDVTLTALWNYPVIVDNGTAEVNGSAYSGPIAPGTTVTLTANAALSGYTFDKWEVVSGGVIISSPASTTATFVSTSATMHVRATYKGLNTISFDSNGGSGYMNSLIVPYGDSFKLPSNEFTAPTDASFLSWLCNNNTYLAEDVYSNVTDNMTFSAVWGYPVTVNNGTSDANGYVKPGTTVTVMAGEAPVGKEFDKWEIVSGSVTLSDETSSVATFAATAEAMEITATYKPIVFTVVFDMQGQKTQIAPQTIEYGGSITKPSDPSVLGYEFEGWYTDEACTTAFDFDKAVTGNVDIFAKWTKVEYTPTVDSPIWDAGSTEPLNFVIHRNVDDSKTFSLFTGVKIDDVLVGSDNYSAFSGSLILDINASYLNTLQHGNHTIEISFADGSVKGTFEIKANDPNPTPSPTPSPAPSPDPTATPTPTINPQGSLPQTGEESFTWQAVTVLIAAAVLAMLGYGYKRKSEEN